MYVFSMYSEVFAHSKLIIMSINAQPIQSDPKQFVQDALSQFLQKKSLSHSFIVCLTGFVCSFQLQTFNLTGKLVVSGMGLVNGTSAFLSIILKHWQGIDLFSDIANTYSKS